MDEEDNVSICDYGQGLCIETSDKESETSDDQTIISQTVSGNNLTKILENEELINNLSDQIKGEFTSKYKDLNQDQIEVNIRSTNNNSNDTEGFSNHEATDDEIEFIIKIDKKIERLNESELSNKEFLNNELKLIIIKSLINSNVIDDASQLKFISENVEFESEQEENSVDVRMYLIIGIVVLLLIFLFINIKK
jgi:hypothetical protein